MESPPIVSTYNKYSTIPTATAICGRRRTMTDAAIAAAIAGRVSGSIQIEFAK